MGTVRIDDVSDGNSILSWTVAPEARGRGVAKLMVKLVADTIPRTRRLQADVKRTNGASISVARNIGMALAEEDGDFLRFVRPAGV